ncbi:hypothetical protein [Acinetobacter amyesii]|uniref:hypothetical protein n=1 Tax=Acinetobacter amyesii TaxID=2942470 RepID=UPI003EFF8E6E
MNKMAQAALAALVFGLGATATYAETARPGPGSGNGGGHGGGHGGHHSGNHGCGSSDCKGKIDIDLVVEKHCDLDIDDTQLTLDKNNSYTDSTKFQVRTNANYYLAIVAPTTLTGPAGSNPVPVAVTTTGAAGAYTSPNVITWDGLEHEYTVQATSAGLDVMTTMAGTYKGAYNVEVKF